MQRDSAIASQVDQFRQASARLQLEGLKNETILRMMNNCADRCELRYFETGIQDRSAAGVECFKNCVSKSYKLGTANSFE